MFEAQRILRESLRVPLLSDNLAGVVDNSSPGNVPVFLLPEDKRGSVLLDEVDVRASDIAISRAVDVDAGASRSADPVVNLEPVYPVAEVSTGGELEVGTVLAGAERGSAFLVETTDSLADVGFDRWLP